MKSKSISKRAGETLTHFLGHQQPCFTYFQALQAFPHLSRNTLAKLLSDMTRQGLLLRLKEGLYHVVPFEQDSASFIPQWHLVVPYLVPRGNYYISYQAALQIHGLTIQPSLQEHIVVNKQIRPSKINIQGITFQFVYHNEAHFFGFQKTWVDDFHQVNCADKEKTLLDSLFKPQYAGGVVEIAKALVLAKDQLDFHKLYNYTEQFGSQAAGKRLGFLLEVLEIQTAISERLQRSKSASFVLLDPELPPVGKRVSRWSIQQNIDSHTIQAALLT